MPDEPQRGEGDRPKSVEYLIQFTKGDKAGQKVPLDRDRITFGRKPGNTVVLQDIRVSGVHAEIVFEGDRPVIRDLGSTNGTLLEGKKIDEMVLTEKDRIRLGDTEFVLLRVGQTLKAPAAGPEEMGEEVRVIRDVRGVRRGAGGLILLVILLIGLGGAAYYYFFHTSSKKTVASVPPARDNLLGDGWSFETSPGGRDITDIWSIKPGPETFFARSKKDARTGLYAALISMPQVGYGRAFYEQPLKLGLRRQYTASAWVKISGRAVAGLKASFYRGGEEDRDRQYLYTDEFTSGREEGLGFLKIQGTVYPPPEAEEMIFEISAAGEGEAYLDDLELFEKSATKPDLLGSSEAMDFFACGGGFAVRRINHTLFRGGRLLALGESPEGDVLRYDSDQLGFTTHEESFLYCGPGPGLVRADRSLEVNAQKIQGSFTMPGLSSGPINEVRYCFDLLPDYAKAGVGILKGEEFSIYGGTFPSMQAEALLFGGSNERVKIIFERPVQVLGEERPDGGASIQCLFKPKEDVRFDFRLQNDFNEETRQAQNMVQQARAAAQDGQYSQALNWIDQVSKRYPYNESIVNRAEELRAGILEKKRGWLAEIRERLKSARFLNTPELFTALRETCAQRLEQFPGDRDFEAALEEVIEQGSTLMNEIRDSEAERYFQIARNLHDAGGREATLAEILNYMRDKYPESEWTKQALALGQAGESPEKEAGAGEEGGG